jgi:hypothetical protein
VDPLSTCGKLELGFIAWLFLLWWNGVFLELNFVMLMNPELLLLIPA